MSGLFQETGKVVTHKTQLLSRNWITENTFEIRFSRPRLFQFAPGQRVRFIRDEVERDYSPVSSPQDEGIDFLVRSVKGGPFYPSERVTVFVATGTGIAPFVSMARAGVKDFIVLHGVKRFLDLYYEPLFRKSARLYVPCLSGLKDPGEGVPNGFAGRVTGYLADHLASGAYDFYLCGNGDMIKDVILLVDQRFPDSRVYAETFY